MNRQYRKSLSIADVVEEGKPYTFVVYNNGDKRYWWHRFLKPGFRHCFVVHFDGQVWMRIEKVFGFMEVQHIFDLDGFCVGRFNLKGYYSDMGYITQEVDIKRDSPENVRAKTLFAPSSCVEIVKEFIGVGGLAITPFQLYKQLERQ